MDKNGVKEGSGVIDSVWTFMVLLVGYPMAFFVLLTSEKSTLGIMGDLKGERGRQIALDWGESLLVAFILAMLIRTFLFQPFKIPSGSMRMTLIEGDRLFVNKLAYGPLIPLTQYRIPGFVKPKRGDVVVFRYPVTRDKDFIKRLIAVGGETVEIKEGTIYINDKPITDGPLAKIHYLNRGDYGAEGVKIKVPEGSFFVMGDNTASSHDSRYWGFVPESLMIGRADVIFWPLDRIRWIK